MKRALKLLTVVSMVGILVVSCDLRTPRLLRGVSGLLDSLKAVHLEDTRTTYWEVGLHGNDGTYSVEGELVSQEAYEALDRALNQQWPEVENRVRLLTDEGTTPLVNGLVNNSVIHLRAQPSSKTEMVTQALMGSPVRILTEKGGNILIQILSSLNEAHSNGPVRILTEKEGKILIQIPSGYLGWVNIPEVQQLDPEQLSAYREAKKVIFTGQYGTVYSEPDEQSLAVSDVVAGCILELVGENREYLQVGYPDGRTGWIRKGKSVPAEQVFYREPGQ